VTLENENNECYAGMLPTNRVLMGMRDGLEDAKRSLGSLRSICVYGILFCPGLLEPTQRGDL
jgi:hypothetical protein